MKIKLPTHSFVKRPSGKCVWCAQPRKDHKYEMVQTENGLQKVAIEVKTK